MMGVTPSDLVNLQADLPVPLMVDGTNCGLGAAEVVAAIINMTQATEKIGAEPILIAKGNCGIAEWVDGDLL